MNMPDERCVNGAVPIAYVIDQMDAGGTERQLIELIAGLDKQRFDPHVVTIRDRNFWGDLGCPTTLFAINRKVISVRGAIQILRMFLMFRRKRIRIVQTFFADSSFMGAVAAWLARVPVIITSRRDLGFWYTPSLVKNLRRLHALSGHVLANSESVRQNVSEREGIPFDDIDVIYNGLDPALFECEESSAQIKKELGIDADSPTVGIVAALDREVKRVDVFVDAVPVVTDKFPAARFVVVGDGRLRGGLERRCRNLGVSDKVIFTGGRTDVYRLLHAFDVGVNCSDSEGFSNAVIEYMFVGIPSVATDVSGNAELISDETLGLLFPPGCPDRLADCVITLLADPQRASSIGEAGRRKATEQFTAGLMVNRHIAYYERLLAATTSR